MEVLCPICQEPFAWPDAHQNLWRREGRTYVPLGPINTRNEALAAEARRHAYVRCPTSQTGVEHYLPWAYAAFRRPLVIGLVADTNAGKTHLLAAMMAEIVRGGLMPYRLDWEPLDNPRHDRFMAEFVQPFIAGKSLPETDPGVVEFIDALVISSPTGRWPVAFFDVSGEDFRPNGPQGRFVIGADGLIFLVDPGTALPTADDGAPAAPISQATAFASVISRMRTAQRQNSYISTPAAIVLNKSDRLRLHTPVNKWMHAGFAGPPLRPDLIRAESRDVYAFLHQYRTAWPWLAPFESFQRCTLHFASATGGEERGGVFPRGTQPRRVLEPLIALFAMTGILGNDPGAREVGV